VVVVVRRARQTADARPGAPPLGRKAVVVERGAAAGAVHQLSEAGQEVRVTVVAGSDAETAKPERAHNARITAKSWTRKQVIHPNELEERS